MTRFILLALLVGACERWAEQPEVRTYGTFQPLCIIFCEAAVETVDSGAGNATAAPIAQSAGGR